MHLRTTSACYAHRAASSRQQLANKKDKLSSGARIKAKTEEEGGGGVNSPSFSYHMKPSVLLLQNLFAVLL